jgi:hypothetical protein
MEITLLKNILTGAGTTMTQEEINAESGCFTCYGMTLAQANILVLLNEIAGVLSGNGGAGLVQAQSGNYAGGTPTWTPTSAIGLAWDTSTSPATEWNYHDGAWH